ncbi:MAG: tripartite tricarboxylate transporter TctB family protein [Thermodesulfobacteriota bacterium]|nr:tripartite tricarboxylate transporter TctB family protein [Thermodesulfobacteriota bacterium]
MMKEKFIRTEALIKLALLAFFGSLYLLSISYPDKSRQFPQLIAIFTLIMLSISLFIDFTQRRTDAGEISEVDDTELKVIDKETKRARKKRFWQAWEIILFSTAIGFLGGFLFTALFLFVGSAFLFGERKNVFKNSAIAVFITIFVYILFQWVMKVPLLGGILW